MKIKFYKQKCSVFCLKDSKLFTIIFQFIIKHIFSDQKHVYHGVLSSNHLIWFIPSVWGIIGMSFLLIIHD